MSWRSRLSTNMQEIRFVFCLKRDDSAGIRGFITRNFADLELLNPRFPLLVRNAKDAEPTIFVRYDHGVTEEIPAADLAEADIEAAVREAVAKGETMPRSFESMPPEDEITDIFRPNNAELNAADLRKALTAAAQKDFALPFDKVTATASAPSFTLPADSMRDVYAELKAKQASQP